MNDQQTCGKGLAENSVLPERVGELTDAVAGILEAHMEALDLTDEKSRAESGAYRELAGEHRRVAAALRKTAPRMAGYRDLPIGRHIPEKMAAPRAHQAFEKFVKLEQELLVLLQNRLEGDWELLGQMRAGGS
jgi:hypothetical protein